MKDPTVSILRKNQLSITDTRRQILQFFMQQNAGAIRHSDIERRFTDMDRVTIYRTLQAFCEKGIIHAIPGTDGAARYAICKSGCEVGHHHDNHVHFVCTRCHQTQCLDDVLIPYVKMPEGFEMEKAEMVVSGVCKNCRLLK